MLYVECEREEPNKQVLTTEIVNKWTRVHMEEKTK